MKNIIVILMLTCCGCISFHPVPVDDFASAQRHHEFGNFEEAARIYGVLFDQGISRANGINIAFAQGLCLKRKMRFVEAYSCFLAVIAEPSSTSAEVIEARKFITDIEFMVFQLVDEEIESNKIQEEDRYAIY